MTSPFSAYIIMSKARLIPLVLIAGATVLSSCGLFGLELTDDELSRERQPYLSDELRMNGYYYNKLPSGDRYNVYFFYRNGVVRYVGSPESLESVNKDWFLDGKAKYEWGVFHIDGRAIAFERWYPPSKIIHHAYIRSGEILNDTTFVITQSRRSNGEEVREKDEIYHFRQFSPKPDSTTRYID